MPFSFRQCYNVICRQKSCVEFHVGMVYDIIAGLSIYRIASEDMCYRQTANIRRIQSQK